MAAPSVPLVDWFLLAILPIAAILLGLTMVMLRRRRSALVKAMADLTGERDRIRNALEGSAHTIWEWDIAADEVWLNANWQEMLGGPAAETRITMAGLLEVVHPDDLGRVQQAAADALKGIAGQFDTEFRVRGIDERWRWIRTRGKVTARDAQGRATRASGTNADITSRKRAEQSLAESESQLRQLVEFMPAAIVFVNREERVVIHNRAYAQLLGLADERMDGRPIAELLGPEQFSRVEPHLRASLAGQSSHHEIRRPSTAGRALDLDILYWPLQGAEGQVEGVIVLGIDITRLKEADRMKDHFISVVSHELRTPLTSMRGSLGLLAGGIAGELPAEAKPLVDIALQNSDRLWRLVDDLLDIEKMSAGHVEFLVAPIAWRALLAEAVESGRGLMRQFDVAFDLEPIEDLRVLGDADRLSQVLANLILNAAKFSPAGGIVSVGAERRPGGIVRTRIRDRGHGIPESFRSRIFQPFSQADTGDSRSTGGTGLGLAISREIVTRLGGTIGFEDAAGGGTVFWFDLPEAPVAE